MQVRFLSKAQYETLLGGGTVTVTHGSESENITYNQEDLYCVEASSAALYRHFILIILEGNSDITCEIISSKSDQVNDEADLAALIGDGRVMAISHDQPIDYGAGKVAYLFSQNDSVFPVTIASGIETNQDSIGNGYYEITDTVSEI